MRPFLFALFLLLFGLPLFSQDAYNYLTIEKSDGSRYSFSIDDLSLTFENGNVVATNGTDCRTFALTETAKLFFTLYPAAVMELPVDGIQPTAKIVNGELIVSGIEHEKANVYTADGRRIGRKNLPTGVYLVKAGHQTIKVAAR